MGLDRLWAGWRRDYIEQVTTTPRPEGCLFCGLAALEDEAALILERTEHTFTIMNAYPYTAGHIMVLPRRHEAELTALEPGEAAALMLGAQRAARVLETVYRPEGLNLGINVGRAAGAGVPEHLHVHLVPRWAGDSNFMTAAAETRVLPETLDQSYERLRAGFGAGGPDAPDLT
ncbi:MAG: HIT family protein [Actinomycetes bacterium]